MLGGIRPSPPPPPLRPPPPLTPPPTTTSPPPHVLCDELFILLIAVTHHPLQQTVTQLEGFGRELQLGLVRSNQQKLERHHVTAQPALNLLGEFVELVHLDRGVSGGRIRTWAWEIVQGGKSW